jgi:hypothetical protein
MHIFTMAECGRSSAVPDSTAQFRHHANIPWDQAYELYFDPAQLKALIKLARHAQRGESLLRHDGLRGRIFDVLREVRNAAPEGSYIGRDRGPYVMVTGSEVWTRIELEAYLRTLTAQDWINAANMGNMILTLARSID